ncbi:MAG: polysaccharide deacetylase family protein [Chitinophagaceae bacterium]|jgi:peptidoglycan/xylan/chitin deacetylase (PgdA/CDA1 family)|nr:polysaccharide deacetylase family protein [Chitinophagaceae bacterium]
MNKRNAIIFKVVLMIGWIGIIIAGCGNTKPGNKENDSASRNPNQSGSKDTVKQAVRNTVAPHYDSTKKYIYLTFDDGPQPGTKEVMDVLTKLNVKGTFFMVGQHQAQGGAVLSKYPAEIKARYPQFLLANHSYTHASDHYHFFYAHPRMAFDDFIKAQQSLDVPKKIIRLPGNTSWVRQHEIVTYNKETRPVCLLLDSAGYNVIGWDEEWQFLRNPSGHGSIPKQSAEAMVKKIENTMNGKENNVKNNVVLLTHDRMFYQPKYTDSLYKFINELKTRHPEYIFETIDNYPGLKE